MWTNIHGAREEINEESESENRLLSRRIVLIGRTKIDTLRQV